MRLAIIGSNGQLGRQFLQDIKDYNITGFDLDKVDITKPETFGPITDFKPDVIVNCAAYNAVDNAENDRELAYKVNAIGPENIAKLALDLGAKFVHFSTDYVFDGRDSKPYSENNQTNPINYYGRTKLEGENLVLKANKDSLVLRTAWLYGMKGPNFVLTMLKLGKERESLSVVDDQIGSPTSTKELVRIVMALLNNNQTGLFHCVNDGSVNRYDFTKEIFHLAGITIELKRAKTAEFPTTAERPLYSALSIDKLKQIYQPETWQEALKGYVTGLNL